MPLWLAMAEMHSAVETESEVKKCSLTAIGKVSTPASRIQDTNPVCSGFCAPNALSYALLADAESYADLHVRQENGNIL